MCFSSAVCKTIFTHTPLSHVRVGIATSSSIKCPPYILQHCMLYTCLLIQLNSDDYEIRLSASTTLYIGNLSFFTSEDQIYELFSMCGDVKRVIMGLDKFKKTPCGFCFVEYVTYINRYFVNGSEDNP